MDSSRRYGNVIHGLDPSFWWWDIIVKRFDTLLMLLVNSTSIADDARAKLLLFPILSGMQLALMAWFKPYTKSRSNILNYLEFGLLLVRFVLFSTIALIIIIYPSAAFAWFLGGSLLFIMACTLMLFGIHFLKQFLKEEIDKIEEQPEDPKLDENKPRARSCRERAINMAGRRRVS